jgi:hypothetical protein
MQGGRWPAPRHVRVSATHTVAYRPVGCDGRCDEEDHGCRGPLRADFAAEVLCVARNYRDEDFVDIDPRSHRPTEVDLLLWGREQGEARSWLGAEDQVPRSGTDDGGRRPRAGSAREGSSGVSGRRLTIRPRITANRAAEARCRSSAQFAKRRATRLRRQPQPSVLRP